MGQHESLLAEVALRLARSPEDVATEALAYVLTRSDEARKVLAAKAADWAGKSLRVIATVRSQAGADEGSRPDIELQDSSGVPVVVVENKFWAGLTNAQPVSYIKRLEGLDGAVWFVAPSQRLPFLWDDLVGRASAVFPETTRLLDQPEIKIARVDRRRILALTSWVFLLGQVRTALESSGDSHLLSDLRQLAGLALRMESAGFLPLTASDLSGPTARHVIQFCQVVDGVVESLQRSSIASTKGLRATGSFASYGRYLKLHGHGCQILFNAGMWNDHGRSPVWLRVSGPDWKHSEAAEHAMVTLLGRDNCIVVGDKYWVGVWTPLRLPVGRELEAVVEDVVAQVAAVAACLQDLSSVSSEEMPPEPEMG
jgi:hypothetical protein